MLDVLIIGSGGAGLTAALGAKDISTVDGVGQGDASILIVGKSYPTNSQTSMAQGGINAALGNVGEDHISAHIADTIKSARGLCDEDMVRQMCADATKTIQWLESIGVPFSRLDIGKGSEGSGDNDLLQSNDSLSPDSRTVGDIGGQVIHDSSLHDKSQITRPLSTISQRQMGGASAKRACYAQDYTGLKILHTLYDTCLKENIDFLDEHYFLNLVVEDGTAKGATFLDIRTGEVKQINAKSIIIATGGYGSIYHAHTTNAYGSTGDGIAAVLRAGGAVSDMEFVQFHPTALKNSSILISESARGEGGYLINSDGERFVDELKPRDEVARAIFEQLQQNKEVFLDVRHLGEEKLAELLPQEVALCKLHEHIDPAKELIPIKPVAHYTMGGIDVDYALEVTGIKGCFAVGECSNSKVHGANRLGGNSLLEITAFGKFSRRKRPTNMPCMQATKKTNETQLQHDKKQIEAIYNKENSINFYEHRDALGSLFYDKVGIIRDNVKLTEAMQEVITMQVLQKKMGLSDKNPTNNSNLIEYLEFQNALLLSPAVISAAIARDESRGAHYKVGFEAQDDEKFKQHIVLQWKD